MDNRNIVRRGTKRTRVKSSSAIQNQALPRKMVIIFDDSWLEALKHLTCPQWSKMSFVCRQVNGIVQRNISRLQRQVVDSITLNSKYLSFFPRFTSVAPSLQKLFHPASYIKNVTMHAVNQKLSDAHFNGEERYIRCEKFALLPHWDVSSTLQKIAKSLKWLERSVRSDSICFPKWMFNKIHSSVKIRAVLTNFIFDTSQKCKAQELIFSFAGYPDRFTYYQPYQLYPDFNNFSSLKLVNVLIEDFLALSHVQGTVPTVVIDQYYAQEQCHAQFGENLIGQEVDSEGAVALYMIENGEKRIRISFVANRHGMYTKHT